MAENLTRRILAEQRRVQRPQVAVPELAPRADERDGHDGQQRRRLGRHLAEAEEDDERGDEQHAAAHAEHAGGQAAQRPDQDGADHGTARSIAVATSSAANSSRTVRGGTRC